MTVVDLDIVGLLAGAAMAAAVALASVTSAAS